MTSKVSPLAPAGFPRLTAIAGVEFATAATGVKYKGRDDLLLAAFAPGSVAAGLLTLSSTTGAPVEWCRQCLASAEIRALVVNAGNANVFTGDIGRNHVIDTVKKVAAISGCADTEVMVASTGVIGEVLPIEKILGALPALHKRLSDDHWQAASKAILTTDTFAKGASCAAVIDGVSVTVNGFAKGSGMIKPNMATLLAFVFTDANIEKSHLQSLLTEANQESFNSITVDSDTSTSDTCLLVATRQAPHRQPKSADDSILNDFREALLTVMKDLALQVVRDGEGASKLIEIHVTGTKDSTQARQVAKSIANSPLVKTAIAGEDANWGRVVMAVGKSGVICDQQKLRIDFGGITITENGRRADDYDEAMITEHLKGREISIEVDLGSGDAEARVWTCDLTHDYISINADYRS